MKRFLSMILCLCLAISAFGCQKADGKTYKISWYDGSAVCSIEVKAGETYTVPSIPAKEGYDFAGLFDAETGGTRYVSPQGLSDRPWSGTSDLTLYAQFTPQEFSLRLEYEGGVEGTMRVKAAYGQAFPDLPVSYKENYDFKGWYAAPDCQGIRYTDAAGKPLYDVFDKEIFDLSASNITLYAGFIGRTVDLVFYVGSAGNYRKVEVSGQYGKKVVDYQPMTLVDGKAISSWSTEQNGGDPVSPDDVIRGPLTLYPAAYAPALLFEVKGGTSVSAVVATAGSTVTLPVSARTGYVFGGWETAGGQAYQTTIMPETTVTLYAVWQRTVNMSLFGEIEKLYVVPGKNAVLPTPEREGYVFAGWYDGDTEIKTFVMPDADVAIKAGWYAATSVTQPLETNKTITVEYTGGGDRRVYRCEIASPSNFATPYTIEIDFSYRSGSRIFPFMSLFTPINSSSSELLHEISLLNEVTEWTPAQLIVQSSVYRSSYTLYAGLGVIAGTTWEFKNLKVTFTHTSNQLVF